MSGGAGRGPSPLASRTEWRPGGTAWPSRSEVLLALASLGVPRPLSRVPVAALSHDILNPFRPSAADPACATSTVLALGISADRAFDRLPILADALEEAGCNVPSMLAHCRDAGLHVRGCWVIDLLPGR